ncbi:DUF2267 domain-containing protein [Caenispirillum salinarum]|uniref:DUF2267 domain-containing protein n=1 Tax=Caenispirillum salinarum TaxID=859058 RepID=UPI00384D224A
MSATGLEMFDKTLQETNIWLNEISEHLGGDKQHAYHALRATLHALRDRLTVEEAAHLGAQFPMMVKGIYMDGWRPGAPPHKERSKDAFLASIQERLFTVPLEGRAEDAARAVFAVLDKHVEEGQIAQVKKMLPDEINSLWPA